MEAVSLGFALGVGAVLVYKHGRTAVRSAVGWSARQVGWVTSRVAGAIDDARSTARREYERGRDANLRAPVVAGTVEGAEGGDGADGANDEALPKSIPPVVAAQSAQRKNGGAASRVS
jgi:hypothetical protein